MRLEELEVYNLAVGMGDRIWDIVVVWDYFAKDTVGKQLVRAADSVAANLSEGSLYETLTWLTKAHNRKLVSDRDFEVLEKDMNTIGRKLNAYIKSIGKGPTTTTNDE